MLACFSFLLFSQSHMEKSLHACEGWFGDGSGEALAGLPRVLGAGEAIAIVIGTVIGSGIFLIPSEMMRDTGSSLLVYLAWIVGGLLSLFGAMTYAELGTMMPYAGGEYVYLRGAYGDTAGFLYMWTWFTVAKPGSIADRRRGPGAHARVLPRLFPPVGCDSRPALHALLVAGVCYRRHVADYRAELPGHQKGGRFSAGVYGAEGGSDSGCGGALLSVHERIVESLPDPIAARGGRLERLHAGADCNLVGL